MGTEGFASAAQHRRLLGAETSFTGTLLRSDLAVGTVDFVACLGGCGALTGEVALEDYGTVQDVAA